MDYFWIEVCWQVLNVVFAILTSWTAPQRLRLLYHVVLGHYEIIVGTTRRSLLFPGVLLTVRQAILLTSLRVINVFFTYVTAWFMWASLRRCLQVNLILHEECSTALDGALIPICMVIGMTSNIAAGGMLGYFVQKCDVMSWPDHHAQEDQAICCPEEDIETRVTMAWHTVKEKSRGSCTDGTLGSRL